VEKLTESPPIKGRLTMPDLGFPSSNSCEHKDKLRENLARIFEFSLSDLSQNQTGKFGDGQMRRLGPKIATGFCFRCTRRQ
jgi:hypothetical protein